MVILEVRSGAVIALSHKGNPAITRPGLSIDNRPDVWISPCKYEMGEAAGELGEISTGVEVGEAAAGLGDYNDGLEFAGAAEDAGPSEEVVGWAAVSRDRSCVETRALWPFRI